MGQIGSRIDRHEIIGLDTSIWIYHLEANSRYLPLTKEILEGIQKGNWQGVVSTLTLMELTVPAWRQDQGMVARQYEALLINFPNLRVIDVDRRVARNAAQLRARFGVRPVDALLVATCLSCGATAFITNDRSLKQLEQALDVLILDDYI